MLSSRIGLGTSRLASLGSSLSLYQARVLISVALDNDVTVIDTSDAYGSGDSERYIAAGVSGRRSECFLMTKAGLPYVALPGQLSPLNQIAKKVKQNVAPGKNYSKQYLLRSLQKSLRRLRTDHVDAFFLHAPVSGEATQESWDALHEIRRQGMSRFTGISTIDPVLLVDALATGQVQIVQAPISVCSPVARTITQLCARHKVPIVANEVLKPLSFLTSAGKIWNDMRRSHGAGGISTVSLLIAYAAAQEGIATVLVGTQSPAHLVDNKQALGLCESMQSLFCQMREAFA